MLRLLTMPHNGGAKDGEFEMSLGLSRTVVGVERVACCGVARSQSLAIAGADDGDSVRQRSSHRNDLVASGRRQQRLPRLVLLPYQRRTQQQFGRLATGSVGTPDFALAWAAAVGNRRFADPALRPASRRRRRASQSDARCGRSALFVRPYLGHDFARRAASPVGSGGIAAASDALRSQANDGDDTQMPAMASLCDQASVGSAIGRMGRSHPEKSWENGLVIVLPSNRTFMT